MEQEKDTCIKAMQWAVSEMALEEKSLEWLMTKNEKLSRSIANCERSAKELREYVINECDGRDVSSEEVKRLKDELVEAIELEAELEKVVVKGLDEEITQRLEASNN